MQKILDIFRKHKRLLIVFIILIITAVGYQIIAGSSKKKPQYQTAKAQKQSIIQTVNESGNVTSSSQAGVGSPTTGIVEEIYVKDGDEVTQKQNLFKVKSIASAQEIASAWASYENAVNSEKTSEQNQLAADASMWKDQQTVLDAQNQVDYKNNNTENPSTKQNYTDLEKQSIESSLVNAHKQFTASETKFKEADVSVAAAKAQLNSAWLAYQATQDSIVTAPIDGTVANISVKAGDQVTASGGNLSSNNNNNSSSTTSSSNAILYIGNYSQPYVKVQASEVDIKDIKADQKATITLDAFAGQTFVGTVDQVDTSGTISSGVVTYNVFITFVSPPNDIKPGMSASVTIQTARKDDVLSIPTAAIQTSSGDSTVRIMKNGKVTQIPIEIGIASDTDTEIVSGLSEGDTVVTGTVAAAATGASNTTSPFGRSIGGFGGGGGGGGGARIGGGGGGRGN